MGEETDTMTARLTAVINRVQRAATDDTPAVETSGLCKRYGTVTAVDRLNLHVDQGEIFGFLGPNGAGKTTTMRMLLGLVQPTAGEAHVLGMNIADNLPTILRRTGSVIENPTFYPYLSGEDNLQAFARLAGIESSHVTPVLALVELMDAARRKFSTYSLGMKQRLAVGAALLGSPDLLILDEPANGLDPAGIVEMRDLVRRLKAYGHTVLISSHVLHEIEQICDRIAIMSHGRIVVQGRVGDLLGAESIELYIEQPSAAKAILSALPWVRDVVQADGHLLVSAAADRGADITRALAAQGLYLSRLQPHEQSLEQYFLDVTGDAR